MYTSMEQRKRPSLKNGQITSSQRDTAGEKSIPNSILASRMRQPVSGYAIPGFEDRMRTRLAGVQEHSQAQIPQAENEADRLSSAINAGTPESVKAIMGRRMGADFSEVRFHTDAAAAAKADAMGARAYTSGADVYFGEGGFDPSVAAHELVHTAQQGLVDSSAPVLSTPAGGVQMWPWSKRREEPEPAQRLGKLGLFSGVGLKERGRLNKKIKKYNQAMQDLEHGQTDEEKSAALEQAAKQYRKIYNRVGSLVNEGKNSSAISQLSQQLMAETVNVNKNSLNEKEQKGWAKDFAGLQTTATGQKLFDEIFRKRNAVNPNERRKVTIKLGGWMKPEAGADSSDPEEKEKIYAKPDEHGDRIMNEGTDAVVRLPSRAYTKLYSTYGKYVGDDTARHTGKIMAAHEMMHALHNINGMALKGKASPDDPYYRPHDIDKAVDLEELATTMVRNRRDEGIAPEDYMINQFKEGKDRDKAAQIYQINESQLRHELHMMPLFSYKKKHDESQIGSNGVTKARLEADEIPHTFANTYALKSRDWNENSLTVEEMMENEARRKPIEALKEAPHYVKKAFRNAAIDSQSYVERLDRENRIAHGWAEPTPKQKKQIRNEQIKNVNRLISQLKKQIPGF